MNETDRLSLERHLNKVFPQWKPFTVTINPVNSSQFNIQGNYTMVDRFKVWSEVERFSGADIEWSEPYY